MSPAKEVHLDLSYLSLNLYAVHPRILEPKSNRVNKTLTSYTFCVVCEVQGAVCTSLITTIGYNKNAYMQCIHVLKLCFNQLKPTCKVN